MTTVEVNYDYNTGDQFHTDNDDRIFTIVGFYTGTGHYSEMYTKTFKDENGLTDYQRWNRGYNMPWTLQDESTLTEMDLVCDMFHASKRLEF